jgi:glutamyl/glutaminyl-tRNA synthetase
LANNNTKLIDIAKPLRIILTGAIVPTGIYELLLPLGKAETLNRISDYLSD